MAVGRCHVWDSLFNVLQSTLLACCICLNQHVKGRKKTLKGIPKPLFGEHNKKRPSFGYCAALLIASSIDIIGLRAILISAGNLEAIAIIGTFVCGAM